MATAPCGRCGAELVERQGLTLIRLFECQECAGTLELRVELPRRFMLRRICLLGVAPDAADEIAKRRAAIEPLIEKFVENYRREEIYASSDLCQSVDGQQWPGSNDADARAARIL